MKRQKLLRSYVLLLCTAVLISTCGACSSNDSKEAAEGNSRPQSQGASSATASKGLKAETTDAAASSSTVSSTADRSPVEKEVAKKVGFIKSLDEESGTVTFDPIEWITLEDTARIKELELNVNDDLPSGFYIYNPSKETESLKLFQNAEFNIASWNGVLIAQGESVSRDKFAQRLKQSDVLKVPYNLTIEKGSITKIEEQYLP